MGRARKRAAKPGEEPHAPTGRGRPAKAPLARVCVMGAAHVDLVVRAPNLPMAGETVLGGPFAMFPGGKGANQAVAAARLGAAVSFVGAVGADAFGDSLRRALELERLDLAHLAALAGAATGVALITVAPGGGNTIAVAPGAGARLDRAAAERARGAIAGAGALLIQLEVPLAASLRAAELAREAGALVVMNAAPACRLEVEVAAVLRCSDVLVVNQTEAAALTAIAARSQPAPAGFAECDARIAPALATQLGRLLAGGARAALITLGASGAAWACGTRAGFEPAFRVEAVDSVGAGDAFCGALAVQLAERAPRGTALAAELGPAVRFASAAGALATTRPGGIPSLPARAEVEALASGRA